VVGYAGFVVDVGDTALGNALHVDV